MNILQTEEYEALLDFKKRHGRYWKMKLSSQWEKASSIPALMQIRNRFGPSWLYSFRFKKEDQ